MTDLQITRLCAEAMGQTITEQVKGILRDEWRAYDPIHDDAQAMALVKKFQMSLIFARGTWMASTETTSADYADPCRAICECVAKMQASKQERG